MLPFAAPFSSRLRDQLSLLRDLNALYDRGEFIHALSIASRMSVLVEMIKSVEGRDHIQDNAITFSTPTDPSGTGQTPVSPLVSKQVYVDDNMIIVSQANLPIFADPSQKSFFSCNIGKWLAQPAFYFAPGKFVSRERLIHIVRNKDGGSHGYSELPPEYVQFAQDAGMISLKVSQAGAPEPSPPIHFATIRQISHELSNALWPSLSKAA